MLFTSVVSKETTLQVTFYALRRKVLKVSLRGVSSSMPGTYGALLISAAPSIVIRQFKHQRLTQTQMVINLEFSLPDI